MMRGLRASAIFVALVATVAAAGEGAASSGQQRAPVLQATMEYPPSTARRAPGILVLGGAEGGNIWAKAVAEQLAGHGYAALAQAYFKAPGLEDQLQQIPIERLERGLDQLVADPRVDPHRIAVVGLSKGAEAALVLASSDRRVRAVIAGSPSDIVWQGIDRAQGTVKSSWTIHGKPLTFVAFAPCAGCKSLAQLYAKSREDHAALAAAAIPVEHIHGPILLIASASDAVWPSEIMASALQERLERHRFSHPVMLLHYPDGGHFTLGPIAEDDARSDAGFGGGTAEGVVAARRDSWPKVLDFLDRALLLRRP